MDDGYWSNSRSQKIVFSDSNGKFELKNIQGKILCLNILKKGYHYTTNSQGNFEYAAFYQENFHVSNVDNPVMFHLHKTLDAEPLYVFSVDAYIIPDGPSLVLNIEKGKVLASGDLAFSIFLGETNEYGSNFTVTMRALNGAGFVLSKEEFLSKAPEVGYTNMITIMHHVDAANFNPEQNFRFYVKTSGGRYASGGVSISLWGDRSKANFGAGVYYNPSGSRNLEFDQDKWINR